MEQKIKKRQQLLEWALAIAITLAAVGLWKATRTNAAHANNLSGDAPSSTDSCGG